jgi:protein O-mannosyl-transferase
MKGERKKYIEAVLFFAVLVLGLYFNTLDNKATNWDDPALFERTALRQVTRDNLKTILDIAPLSTYQPVRDLTYMLDFALWGPGQNSVTFGVHLQNMVLFLLMVLACWLFLLELFRLFLDDDSQVFLWSVLSCTLFAVHPVHVESVAWLFARKEPLLGMFTCLSMWAFIRGRVSSGWYYLASVLFLILAVLSQPTALMIPAVILVLDLAIQSRRPDASYWKKRLFVLVPMLLLVIPMGMRLIVMMHNAGGIKPYHGGTVWTNLLAVSQILFSYVYLIGFTLNYSADYPIRLFTDPRAWQAWAYVALNLCLVGSALIAYGKKHYLFAFFVAWYYIFLLPVSHIFPINQILTDRYALLPSLSWCVLLGYGFTRLWVWRPASSRFSPEFPTLIAIAVFAMVTVFYAVMTFHQNDVWKDSQTLWEDTLAKYPKSSPGNVNLAAIYLNQGRFREVQDLCLTAIREKPYDYLAISNLALSQLMMGQFDNSIHNYKQAIALKPELYRAKLGLAFAYWLKKDYADSFAAYDEVLSQGVVGGENNQYPTYLYRAGFAAWKIGKKEEAQKYLAIAQAASAADPNILDDLGAAYTSMGDYVRARAAFQQFSPLVTDEKSRKSLARLLEVLDSRISLQAGGAAQGAKP